MIVHITVGHGLSPPIVAPSLSSGWVGDRGRSRQAAAGCLRAVVQYRAEAY